MNVNDRLCLTANDIAAQMQLSLPMVYDLFHREDFPVIRVGRCIRVPKAAFEAWLLAQTDKDGVHS